MKRMRLGMIIALLLVVVLLFSACGKVDKAPEDNENPGSNTEPSGDNNEPSGENNEPSGDNTQDSDSDPVSSIKRKAAEHTYTSFADGKGYAKLTDYEDTDLYVSISKPYDYSGVFYGYTMSGYYQYYPNNFQDAEENDYYQLLKEEIGSETFVQVNDTIKGYLQKIAAIYYNGEAYSSYWTYFCFILEDSQEYQQLYDAKGNAKITGYAQSDLYVSNKSVLNYAFYGSTMAQYYSWYEDAYGYFSIDGVDYYNQLTAAMNGELYVQVTDDICTILKKISLAYWESEDYWACFCFIKSAIIPEGKTETIVTNYYDILVEQCGRNQFVKVNATIKEALQYLSLSYFKDAQYWDYWCYTTYAVTGETKAEDGLEYTCLTDADGEYKTVEYSDDDLYVNLDVTYEYTWNYTSTNQGAYSIAQWYSYGSTYSANFIKTEVVEVND